MSHDSIAKGKYSIYLNNFQIWIKEWRPTLQTIAAFIVQQWQLIKDAGMDLLPHLVLVPHTLLRVVIGALAPVW